MKGWARGQGGESYALRCGGGLRGRSIHSRGRSLPFGSHQVDLKMRVKKNK